MSWLKKKKKEPVIYGIYNKLVPMVVAFKGVMKGVSPIKNHARTEHYLEQLNDFCLHPLRPELDMTIDWINGAFATEFPHIKTLAECMYRPFLDTLTEEEITYIRDNFYTGLGTRYDCYMLLPILRRVMVLPKLRLIILHDGIVQPPSSPTPPSDIGGHQPVATVTEEVSPPAQV